MPTVVYECDGVELREAGGETFSTVVKDGSLKLTVDGNKIEIKVAGQPVSWVPDATQGPFKRIDARSFMFCTNDLMTFQYVTLPKGIPESKYEHFNAVLSAVKDGQPIPAAAPLTDAAAAPADTSTAGSQAAGSSAAKPGNPFGELMSAIAQKAAHDTMKMGDMIKQKAAHDMQSLQGNQHKPA